MKPGFHQITAGATPGDAITQYALEIQELVRATGAESSIFAPPAFTSPDLKNSRVLPLSALASRLAPEDFLFYHYSIGSEATDVYFHSKARKILCYHNLTPPEYYQALDSARSHALQEGRAALRELTKCTELAVAVSEFNRKDLEQGGFPRSRVLPLTISRDYLETAPDPGTLKAWDRGLTHILFVGRMVPNKRFEDILRVFAAYHHTCNPNSRLHLAGSWAGMNTYYRYLYALAYECGFEMGRNCVFHGHVPLPVLVALYHRADALLCLSHHEGFCLPVLEAMHFEVPVFALNRAALPETLRGAGVLLDTAEPRATAELLHQVLSNPAWLREIKSGQKNALAFYSREAFQKRLQSLLEETFHQSLTPS